MARNNHGSFWVRLFERGERACRVALIIMFALLLAVQAMLISPRWRTRLSPVEAWEGVPVERVISPPGN